MHVLLGFIFHFFTFIHQRFYNSKKQIIAAIILCASFLALISWAHREKNETEKIIVTNLSCEYLSNPLGIDVVKPRLGWHIVAMSKESRGVKQKAYQIIVASSLELLNKNIGNLWNSGKVDSDQSVHVEYDQVSSKSKSSKALSSEMRCYWKVRVWVKSTSGSEQSNKEVLTEWSQPAMWSMGLLEPQNWRGKWIGLDENHMKDTSEHRRLSARMLRREFDLKKKVVQATAYVCGLGFFDLYINGELIEDHLMNPALTGYDVRDLYVTFDVTSKLKNGFNAIGVVLSNGRFFAPRLKVPVPMRSFGFPKLLMQMNIEFEDGTRQMIVTDADWKVTSNGPIRSSNEYDGEEYDARRSMPGWAAPGFDDSSWRPAQTVNAPGGKLEAQMIEPIRVTEILKPKRILNPKPGVWMVDFGQSFYGVVKLRVSGTSGSIVKMHTSFNILPDGTLKYQNDRSALNMDIYTLKGEGIEEWHPRFKGNAIRWIQVEGFPGTPTLENFDGLVIHTDHEPVGQFNCSNDLINRIYLNARWGTRMQNRSVPMEPDRDERMPWSGHPAKTSESEGWVFNVAKLYDHFLHNYRVHQAVDGSLQEILPPYWTFNSKDILWPSVATIIPDWYYNFYGDKQILKDNYNMMKQFVLYHQKVNLKSDFTTDKNNYGDWVNAINMGGTGAQTPGPLMATAYFYNNCKILERAAGILNNREDEFYFKKLTEKVYDGFNHRFLNKSTGVYESGSQTAYILPLAFGLVPKEHYNKVVSNLVKDIVETRKGYTSVGLIGMQWQMQVLTNIGRPDVAYMIATRTERPSWGYMISKGATTSWELWDSDTTGPGMNGESQKILSGNFEAWCFQTIGGINYDPDKPGFKHIILKPEPVGDLKFAKASHKSIYGTISSDWKIENGKFIWNISIPPNTTATVYVPGEKWVTENGKLIPKPLDINTKQESGDLYNRFVIEVGSGNYQFTSDFEIFSDQTMK